MKKFSIPNINTPEYWEKVYAGKQIDETKDLRQREYMKLLPKDAQNVIELGCGTSCFPVLAKGELRIPQVFGLDFTPHLIQFLKDSWSGPTWVLGDALNTPFRDGFFDATVAGEIIEHFEEPSLLITEMARITKKGGIMILSTAKVEFEDPEHLWEFDSNDILDMLKPYGTAETKVVESQMFPGRSYTFGWVVKD